MRPVTPLSPKSSDGILRVLIVGRVSTPQQNVTNIEAGYEYTRRYLDHLWRGELVVEEIGEQGSGMRTDRQSIIRATAEIESGKFDLVLMEDVSKPYRNPRWIYAFIQDCVDLGVRVIAPGDNLDTKDETWEVNMGAAALRHGLHIPDTRRRVRRTALYSFHRGGMVLKVRYGYRKLSKEEADSGMHGPKGLRIAKVSEATAVIREMCQRRLVGSAACVAQWLNDHQIAPGPYATTGRWVGRLVDDFLRDPILHGVRTFRDTVYEPVYRTGKHRRSQNASPETEHYPELAHISKEEHQALIDHISRRQSDCACKSGAQHPLYRQPRSRSLWPGQHARCGICKGLMYRWGAFLRCSNAVPNGQRTCWNRVQVHYTAIYAKVLSWVRSVLDSRPSFREWLLQYAWEQYQRLHRSARSSVESVDARIEQHRREERNLANAIAAGGRLDALVTKLAATEAAIKSLTEERERMLAESVHSEFGSKEDMEGFLDSAMEGLAAKSYEFASLLRRLIPSFEIAPVQALDTPQVRPRARLTLSLAAWTDGEEKPFETSTTLDLFEPPEHIQHAAACVAERQVDHASYQRIADKLGIGRMTVKRALAYARRMEGEGTREPFRELLAPPKTASRWKRRTDVLSAETPTAVVP